MFVLIIDDHPLFREGLKALLSSLDPSARTAAYASVTNALAAKDSIPVPDLVLLDMALPGTSRLDALKVMSGAYPNSSIVVVSGDEDPMLIRDAIEAGAAGYIPKTTDPELTIQALRLVLAHGTYMPRSALALQAAAPAPVAAVGAIPQLSKRKLAVLKALLQGKQNKVIADELDMAEGTVKAHLFEIYQVLGVSTRAQAMYRAHEMGIFDLART